MSRAGSPVLALALGLAVSGCMFELRDPPCQGVDLQTDAANCGSCGRDCGGGACSAGVCAPVELIRKEGARFVGITVTDDALYVTDPGPEVSTGTIYRAGLDGEGLDPVFEHANGPQGIDNDGNRLVWVHGTDGQVWQGAFDGTSADSLTINDHATACVVIHRADGAIYAARVDGANKGIWRIVAKNEASALLTGQDSPFGVATTADALYWRERSDGRVWRAGLDGSDPVVLLEDGGGTGEGCMASTEDTLFWTPGGSGTIERFTLSTGARVTLAEKQGTEVRGVAVGGRFLYWTAGPVVMRLAL